MFRIRRKRRRATLGIDVGSRYVKSALIDHSGDQPEIASLGVGVSMGFSDAHDDDGDADGGAAGASCPTFAEVRRGAGTRPVVATAVNGIGVAVARVDLETGRGVPLREIVRWEADSWMASELIDHRLEDFSFDAVGPASSELGTGEPGVSSILAVAARRDLVSAKRELLAAAGLAPELIEVNATALHNAARHAGALNGTCAVVDLGHSGSVVNLVESGRLVSSERTEVGADDAWSNPADAADVVADFLDTLSTQNDSFEALSIGKIWVAGGIPPDSRFLQQLGECMMTECNALDPFQNLTIVPDLEIDFDLGQRAPQFSVAIGLALRSGSPG